MGFKLPPLNYQLECSSSLELGPGIPINIDYQVISSGDVVVITVDCSAALRDAPGVASDSRESYNLYVTPRFLCFQFLGLREQKKVVDWSLPQSYTTISNPHHHHLFVFSIPSAE